MSIRTSLTAPLDREGSTPSQRSGELTENEVAKAVKELSVSFPRREKTFCDPKYSNQIVCLHSFIPSKGATPDADGIYGMIKCRGTFPDIEQSSIRAEEIIRGFDSFHRIYTSYVGQPFPLCDTSKFSQEVNEIDLQKKIDSTMKEDLKVKKEEDRKEIEDIQNREKKLLEEGRKNELYNTKLDERDKKIAAGEPVEEEIEEISPDEILDKYTQLRIKRAQLIYTFVDTKKKLMQVKSIVKDTEEELKELEKQDPSYLQNYRERYMEARRQAHLPDNDESFMKYLGDDIRVDMDI